MNKKCLGLAAAAAGVMSLLGLLAAVLYRKDCCGVQEKIQHLKARCCCQKGCGCGVDEVQ